MEPLDSILNGRLWGCTDIGGPVGGGWGSLSKLLTFSFFLLNNLSLGTTFFFNTSNWADEINWVILLKSRNIMLTSIQAPIE